MARGELAAARGCYEEASAIWRDLGDLGSLAGAQSDLGMVAVAEGDLPQARRLFEESMPLARAAGDAVRLAWLLFNLGVVEARQSQVAAARRHRADALALLRRAGNRQELARLLGALGWATGARDYAETIAFLEESLALVREDRDSWEASRLLQSLGYVSYQHREYARAAQWRREAEDRARQVGDHMTLALALNLHGDVLRAQGEDASAAQLYTESVTLFAARGNRLGVAGIEHNRGYLAPAPGRGRGSRPALRRRPGPRGRAQ